MQFRISDAFQNNNVTISGRYKLLWWEQPGEYSSLALVLAKIGLDPELINWNMNLTNLEVEDVEEMGRKKKSKQHSYNQSPSVSFKFGFSWDRMLYLENIRPGQIVEEKLLDSSKDQVYINNNNNNTKCEGLGYTSVARWSS